jgi:hypothetical protein
MKMKQTFTFLVWLTIILSLVSCEEYRCIKGDGNLTLETRELEEPVERVFLENSFDVFITLDTTISMTVETDENLMPYIETNVVNGDLVIQSANNRCLRSQLDIKRVNLSVPSLSEIHLEGSGDIEIVNDIVDTTGIFEFRNTGSGNIKSRYIFGDKLFIDILGSGDVIVDQIDVIDIEIQNGGSGDFEAKLQSVATKGFFAIDGSGDIRADKMRLHELNMDIAGSGDILCWVERLIYGEITGSGNLYYRFLPLEGIRIDIYGSGDYYPL